MRNKFVCDFYSGIFLFLLGIILLVNMLLLDYQPYDIIGSKSFPEIISSAIIVLGLLLSYKTYKMAPIKPELFNFKYIYERSLSQIKDSKPLVFFIMITSAYFIAMEIGIRFIYATPFYLFAEMILLDKNKFNFARYICFIFYSLVMTTAIYFIFEKFLSLLLP